MVTTNAVPYPACEQFKLSTDFSFSIAPPDLNSLPLPHVESVQAYVAIPEVVVAGLLVVLIALIWVRPRLRHKHLDRLLTAIWITGGLTLSFLAAGAWTLPTITESLWRLDKHAWASVVVRHSHGAAHWLAKKVEHKAIHEWAEEIQKSYRHILSTSMVHQMNAGDWHGALLTADSVDRDDYTIPFIEAVYLHAAERHLQAKEYSLAMNYANQAYELRYAVVAANAANTIFAHHAWADVRINQLESSMKALIQISPSWQDARYPALIDAVQSGFMVGLSNNVTLSSIENTIAISEELLKLRQGQSESISIPCNLTMLYEMQALASMKQGDTAAAIAALLRSIELVNISPTTTQILPQAYSYHGFAFMENDDPLQAVAFFQKAYELSPNADMARVTADALRSASLKYTDQSKFAEAKIVLDQANNYFESVVQTRKFSAEINLKEGLKHMRDGQWELAHGSFSKIIDDPDLGVQASYFIEDLGPAKHRHTMIKVATGLGLTPNVSGQYCTEFSSIDNGHFTCTAVILFDGELEMGRSIIDAESSDFSSVYFGSKQHHTALIDTDGDRRYDIWKMKNSDGSVLEMIDTDRDYRPDWERRVSEGVVMLKPLSGRISVRILGGVVGKPGLDLFSRPDIYLGVWKNSDFMGRTETANNTTLPRFDDYFVINYTYGDTLTIAAFDEDWFGSEFVDRIDLHDLPVTDYWVTERQYVALSAIVTPTDRPEGFYEGFQEPSDIQHNVFEDPGFVHEQSPLGNIVRSARAEDARAEIMSLVAAIAVPEVAIAAAMSRANFASKFTAAWVGFDVTLKSLN